MRFPVALVAASCAAVAACGSTTGGSSTPWAPSHPNPQGVEFAAAEGICAITVRYPADAPGWIYAQGVQYVQRDRGAAPADRGAKLATSGDWTLYQPDPHTLLLVTPQYAYTYKDGANCGSNSAAPT